MSYYEDSQNFNHRLTVETTYSKDDVRDHREGFTQREYFRNQQAEQREPDPAKGFPPMKSVTKAPRKKTKADLELEKANNQDLNKRNIKNK